VLVGLLDRERRFEEVGNAAEYAGLDGGVAVVSYAPDIHRALHDQDLLQCGVVTAVAFDGSSIAEGVSQKRHGSAPGFWTEFTQTTGIKRTPPQHLYCRARGNQATL